MLALKSERTREKNRENETKSLFINARFPFFLN